MADLRHGRGVLVGDREIRLDGAGALDEQAHRRVLGQRILARAGQAPSSAKPVLEINPDHDLVVSLAGIGDERQDLREDAAHLLYDEARILDGELPTDPKAFSQRLARVMRQALG
jgi:HSP90 family molecular chaperone